MKADFWIAGGIVALCAFAVLKQVGVDPLSSGVEPLKVGEQLDLDLALRDVSDIPATVPLKDLWGSKFTVLYTWSIPCPCVGEPEPRMKALFAKYNERSHGVTWIAVDGEPTDSHANIRKLMARLHAFYKMVRDPEQELCQRLGFQHAVQVALFDEKGTLLYRGSIDDNYEAELVSETYLADALEAATSGRPIEVAESGHVYGCAFSDPASCEEYKELNRELAEKREANPKPE